jgi:hypothetical protein
MGVEESDDGGKGEPGKTRTTSKGQDRKWSKGGKTMGVKRPTRPFCSGGCWLLWNCAVLVRRSDALGRDRNHESRLGRSGGGANHGRAGQDRTGQGRAGQGEEAVAAAAAAAGRKGGCA